MAETDSELQPTSNEPFARTITWRVFDETVIPAHIVRREIFTGRAVSGPMESEVDQRQSLSLSAVIRGRERDVDVSVTRAVLANMTDERTYETRTGEFLARIIVRGAAALWLLALAPLIVLQLRIG